MAGFIDDDVLVWASLEAACGGFATSTTPHSPPRVLILWQTDDANG
jgi:hypothetical protein